MSLTIILKTASSIVFRFEEVEGYLVCCVSNFSIVFCFAFGAHFCLFLAWAVFSSFSFRFFSASLN